MVNSERVRRLSAELIPLRRKRRLLSIYAILKPPPKLVQGIGVDEWLFWCVKSVAA